YDKLVATIAAANTLKKGIWISGRQFDIGSHTLNIPNGVSFFGNRTGTIKFANSIAMHPDSNVTISGIKFLGSRTSGRVAGEIAIKISGKNNIIIENNIGENLGECLVFVDSTVFAIPAHRINQVKGNFVVHSNAFYKSGFRGEYVAINNNTARYCDTAIVRRGGNNEIVGGIFTNNGVFLYDGNDGVNANHAICTGVTANHNVYTLICDGLTNGLGNHYTGNSFQPGKILIKNSVNIVINENHISFQPLDSIINDNSSLFMSNNTIDESAHYTEINGGTHKFKNNILFYSGGSYGNDKAIWESVGILASDDFANQGDTTKVLQGNANGNPKWTSTPNFAKAVI